MGGTRRHLRLRHLRGLVAAAAILLSAAFVLPDIARNAEAGQPTFSRPNVRIDTGAIAVEVSQGGGPSIAVDSTGVLHAVWSDTRTSIDKGVYYARSSDGGATWIGELRIDGQQNNANVAPSIAIDLSTGPYGGRIYVVWQRGETSNADTLFASSSNGGLSWGTARKIDSAPLGIASTYPRVTVDSDGAVYVAYQDTRSGSDDIFFTYSFDGGTSWMPDSTLPSTADFEWYPALAASGGTAYVAWEEHGPLGHALQIAVSSDKGATWQKNPIVVFGSGTGSASWVSITVDVGSVVHAAWVAFDSSGIASVVYSKSLDAGLTWSAPVTVDDAYVSPIYSPHCITVLANRNDLYVIWADNRRSDYDIYATWSSDRGLTWGDSTPDNDVRVDDTDENGVAFDDTTVQTSPSAVAGPSGVYVVWSDDRDLTNFRAYSAVFDLSAVVVTEITDGPNGAEQIEIFVEGINSVDLTGWTLDADGLLISLSPLGTVAARTYRTIGDPVTSNIVRDITLRDEGGHIRLIDSSGILAEEVSYGQLGPVPDPLDAESVSRVPMGFAFRSSWTRTPTSSFGFPNNVPQPVVNSSVLLNEVFFNAANPNDRFIEIFFKGAGSFDLAGYVLAGDAAYTIPTVLVSDSDRRYGIRASDAPLVFSGMATAGDNLYLYDPYGAFVDMAGWSSAHAVGMSMVRVPEGSGTSDGYNDSSSLAAGWQFDQSPSLSLVSVGPDQTRSANPGDRVYYTLTAKNKGPVSDYLNIEAVKGALGWAATLLKTDGVTPLQDSPGDPDDVPDVGLVASGSFGVFFVAIDVPWSDLAGSFESTIIRASMASDPLAGSSATLKTVLYPFEAPMASANPSAIWVDSAPPFCVPKESTIRLSIWGKGTPVYGGRIQDTVMLMDSSGSMTSSDPSDLRLAAAKRYIDLLTVPDRAAVVDFDTDAFLVNGDHLSSNYAQIKANIDTIDSSGGTDIVQALIVGTDELIGYGDSNHRWIEILLTDGQGGLPVDVYAQATRAAQNGITIFTIGLGNGINEIMLREIARITGGMYLKANTANDLDQIYQMIGNITKSVAGYDDDVTDDIPMVSVFVPGYLDIVPGSFNPLPAYAGGYQGMTNLQWNISQLKIDQQWIATFRVTSGVSGYGLAALAHPDSRVTYIRHDDLRATIPFPEVFIDVIPSPLFSDLAVAPTDITFSTPTPIFEGDLVYINATVYNVGQNASGQSSGKFYDGLPPVLQIGVDQPLAPIAVGAGQGISVIWTAIGLGPHDICVEADPYNAVYEINEFNNVACTSVSVIVRPPTRPDYVPLEPMPAAAVRIGMSVTLPLSIRITNQGNATTSITSELVFGNLTGAPFAQFAVPPIAPSDLSQRFTVYWRSPTVAGIYRIRAYVDYLNEIAEWDEANNEYVWTVEVVPPPVTTLLIGNPSHRSSYTFITSATPLDFSVDDRGGTGILRTMYQVDYGVWRNYTATGEFRLGGDGEHVVQWYSEDAAGNSEEMQSAVLVVDDTPPATTLSVGDPRYVTDRCFVTSHTVISLQAEDRGSIPVGTESTSYRVWDGQWSVWDARDLSFMLKKPDGLRHLEYYSIDRLGNAEAILNTTVIVDDTPPTMQLSPEESNVEEGTEFDLWSEDGEGSGVKLLRMSKGGGQLESYHGRFSLPRGTHKIVYMATDNLGNTAQKERIVNVASHDVDTVVVRFNYKPTIAFLFSLLIIGAAALSAKKRPLRRWEVKVPWRKFAASWAVLSLPFVTMEAVTGVISIFVEPMRVPPLLGWGMAVDLLILGLGLIYLLGRILRRGKSAARGKEKEKVTSVI